MNDFAATGAEGPTDRSCLSRSILESLRVTTTIVADSCDAWALSSLCPFHFNASPSRVLEATSTVRYARLAAAERAAARRLPSWNDQLSVTGLKITVRIGADLLKLVPGRVFVDVDPQSYYDRERIRRGALQIVSEFAAAGIGPARVLISIPGTWEGIQAADRLQADGMDTHIALVFGLDQAIACADVGAAIVSFAVGVFNARSGCDADCGDSPSAHVIRTLQHEYESRGFATAVMAADIRSSRALESVAGCDLVLVEPGYTRFLDSCCTEMHSVRADNKAEAEIRDEPAGVMESQFRWAMGQDAIASTLLAEGIRVKTSQFQRLLRKLVQATSHSNAAIDRASEVASVEGRAQF